MKIHYSPYLSYYKGWRVQKIIDQGLEKHPEVELVDNPDNADFILMHSCTIGWCAFHPNRFKPERNQQEKDAKELFAKYDPKKLMFIDFWDLERTYVRSIDCVAYFLSAWSHGVNQDGYWTKVASKHPPHFHPTGYGVLDEMIFPEEFKREIDVSCLFRNAVPSNRKKALNVVNGLKGSWKKFVGLASPDGGTGRANFNEEYYRTMKKSKIVVTCQPNTHEGDNRTWEAFSSGALVAVDKMHAPWRFPLKDKEHCIMYDCTPAGYKYLEESILYYLNHPKEREEVARNGYDRVMKHHTALGRVDDIIHVAKNIKF